MEDGPMLTTCDTHRANMATDLRHYGSRRLLCTDILFQFPWVRLLAKSASSKCCQYDICIYTSTIWYPYILVVVEAVEAEPKFRPESPSCGGMLEWDATSLLMPVASPLPSTSSAPRIQREQTQRKPRIKLEPIIKQEQTQQEPRMRLLPRIK